MVKSRPLLYANTNQPSSEVYMQEGFHVLISLELILAQTWLCLIPKGDSKAQKLSENLNHNENDYEPLTRDK